MSLDLVPLPCLKFVWDWGCSTTTQNMGNAVATDDSWSLGHCVQWVPHSFPPFCRLYCNEVYLPEIISWTFLRFSLAVNQWWRQPSLHPLTLIVLTIQPGHWSPRLCPLLLHPLCHAGSLHGWDSYDHRCQHSGLKKCWYSFTINDLL